MMAFMKFLVVLLAAPAALGFTPMVARRGLVPQQRRSSATTSTLVMGQTPLTNGKKKIMVAEGSSMMAACKKLGINVKTNCKKGDCGTCTVNVGGKSVRACVGKVPPAPKLKSVLEKGLMVK